MIYLYGYLVIGALVVIQVLITERLNTRAGAKVSQKTAPSRASRTDPAKHDLFQTHVIPFLIGIGAIVLWPLALLILGKGILPRKASPAQSEKKEFSVERAHLQDRLTVAKIESREQIDDPLGAVPQLPFGHLNERWNLFRQNLRPDDELWSFTASWETHWGGKEIRTGYVQIRQGEPARFFLTMRKPVDAVSAGTADTDPIQAA